MIINHNMSSIGAYRQLTMNNAAQNKSMEKLSTGLRINRGADDAAGLNISERMRAQIRGLDQAKRNSQDGISMLQTADGALGQAHDVLQRMRELTVQAANDTNGTTDRAAIDSELDQLKTNLTDMATQTKFNDQAILNDGAGTAGVVKIQTGANGSEQMTITMTAANNVNLSTIAGTLAVDVSTAAASTTFLGLVDTAISNVSSGRSYLGAMQNGLEYTINNLSTASENTTAAESRIRDVDMAKEVMENSKKSILSQAAQAMLAQANQAPQGVLQLLR
ncbi:MAG: flagellin [Ignavibacteriales bacterium]